ncbi:MAG: hypothetical protein ACOZNI_32125 [Myxococcota bacterium]
MRELRTCPVTGRIVLLNDAWVDAPPTPAPPEPGPCALCEPRGPVIMRFAEAIAVPYPTPALGVEGDARPSVAHGAVRRDAVGAHEVLYGAHDAGDGDLLRLLAHRLADLRGDERLRGFGATRRHAPGRHVAWQLFALPFDVAPTTPARWRDAEVEAGERVVDEDVEAVALLAWAPRVPFETWVMPTDGAASFGHGDPAGVAEVLARTVAKLARALRDAPIDLSLADGEPWRIELLPRVGTPRAVEVATGVPIHGTFPEAAAAFLREDG